MISITRQVLDEAIDEAVEIGEQTQSELEESTSEDELD